VAFLVLTRPEVERLLPMRDCIDAMADALAALARGDVEQPLRLMVTPARARGIVALMPAHVAGEHEALGFKAVSIFHGNAERGLDTHQGAVCLLDPETGELSAVLDAAAVTAIRTAAVSGVATRLLAREDARELALLGAGVQAASHLEAMRAVRPIERVRVWNRTPERAGAFAREHAVEAVATAEEAVRGADVVVTATAAREPVVHREWLAPGAHVNSVGYVGPTGRELDTATVAEAALYVDRRESAFAESGNVLLAGVPPEHVVGDLGELVLGLVPGRQSPDQLTVFESLGLAVEDVVAARLVVERARAAGVGTTVPF
jgi:ornithine cyclodeaminase/alanine dehydrogenase-like protein (mu-crystallin family)